MLAPLEELLLWYNTGFLEGVGYACPNFAQFMENTIQPHLSQKAPIPRQFDFRYHFQSNPDAPGSLNSTPPPLSAIGNFGIAPLAGSDGQIQAIVAADYLEPQPNTEWLSAGPLPSDELFQGFATGVIFDTEHQMPIPGTNSSLNSSPLGQRTMPHPTVQPPECPSYFLIADDNSSTNRFEITSLSTPQTRVLQLGQQPAAGSECTSILDMSNSYGGTETLKHWCDICDRSFSRPYLLEDHKRTHTGEETSSE